MVDPNEGVDETCARELHEEANMTVTNIHAVSMTYTKSSGAIDESAVTVYCDAIGSPSNENAEAGEDIEVMLWSQSEVASFLKQQEKNQTTPIDVIAEPVFQLFAKTGFIHANQLS